MALVRVLLWHTWSWWWLSWIPAMPAMFFGTGALLEDSLARRGWWPTVRQRLRRLLLPFWAYAVAAVLTMLALGWRPVPSELVGWVVPLVDPGGSAEAAGLWIPLWYVRAYLWFVLAAGVMRWALARGGDLTVVGAAAATAGLALAESRGVVVPLAVGEAVAYSVFVLAGMRYRSRGAPSRPAAVALGVAAAVAALWWWSRFGPADGVVNRSLVLTVLVGAAGVAAAVAARGPLSSLSGRPRRIVDLLGRRALSIYLWQGFGLLAAQRLVAVRLEPGPVRAAASLAVVVAVTAAAVAVFGPLEDRAAARPARSPGRWGAVAVPVGLAVVLVALVLPLPALAVPAEAPLSGRAVVTRAEDVRRSLEAEAVTPSGPVAGPVDEAARPAAVAAAMDDWVAANGDAVRRVGLGSLDAALVTASGRELSLRWEAGSPTRVDVVDRTAPPIEAEEVAWWSMTKTVTATWLMRAVADGVVRLDDPLSRWVPDVPDADRMTLEHLARHTAGLPGDLDRDFLTATPALAVQDYRDRPGLVAEPGTTFEYSRLGYFLLALALERATGTAWREAAESLAAEAGVRFSFDEDRTPFDEVTDPDGRGYRGGLWSSGGILSPLSDGARFLRWALTEGLPPDAVATMTSFSADPERWYYGIGLVPLCPCRPDGPTISADRYGLDAVTGFLVVDGTTGAALMARPDDWFDDDGPGPELFDLQRVLLDRLG